MSAGSLPQNNEVLRKELVQRLRALGRGGQTSVAHTVGVACSTVSYATLKGKTMPEKIAAWLGYKLMWVKIEESE